MAHAIVVGVYDEETESFPIQFLLNDLVGAFGLYNQGVLGTHAVVANIEAGFVGTNNEPLGSQPIVHLPTSADAAGQIDHHATMTGHVLAGRGSFDPAVGSFLSWELGIAPMATFYSGAIATTMDEDGTFDLSETSFFTPYYHAMKGWTAEGTPYAAADVINSSWGDSEAHDGSDLLALSMDALIHETKKIVVVSTGNGGPSSQVGSPAAGMNTIAVGALGGVADPDPYTTIAEFSSGGPNHYFLPADAAGSSGTVLEGVRAAVDIVAPGEDFVLAYEGDENQIYLSSGTSFAAPTVAGGLALMVDAGRQLMDYSYNVSVGDTLYVGVDLSERLIDARTMKAILLTSANRDLPGWDNGQASVDAGDGRTIIRTTQALDWRLGAGAADFTRAVDLIVSAGAHNFTAGGERIVDPVNNTFAVGSTGWDFNTLSLTEGGGVFGYEIETMLRAVDLFAVSLTWFAEATYQASFGTDNMDVNLEDTYYGSFMDLNLLVYLRAEDSEFFELYAESVSLYNTVELLQFELPYDAFLRIEVVIEGVVYNFSDADSVDYGIAWQTLAVPEPVTCVLVLGFAGLAVTSFRRRPR